jgi:phosphoglycolate phosphatase
MDVINTPVKHIIFDMDGTLSDTATVITAACNEAAEQLGLPPLSNVEVKGAIGYPVWEFCQHILPGQDEPFLRRFEEKMNAAEEGVMKMYGKELLFDGVADTLAALGRLGIVDPLYKTENMYYIIDYGIRSDIQKTCNRI